MINRGIGGFYQHHGPVVSKVVLIDGMNARPQNDGHDSGSSVWISKEEGKRFREANDAPVTDEIKNPVRLYTENGTFSSKTQEISRGLATLSSKTLLEIRDAGENSGFLGNIFEEGMRNLLSEDERGGVACFFTHDFEPWMIANDHLLDKDPPIYGSDSTTPEDRAILEQFGRACRRVASASQAQIPTTVKHGETGSRIIDIAPGLSAMPDQQVALMYQGVKALDSSFFSKMRRYAEIDDKQEIAKAIHPHYSDPVLRKADLYKWVENNRPHIARGISQGKTPDQFSNELPEPRIERPLKTNDRVRDPFELRREQEKKDPFLARLQADKDRGPEPEDPEARSSEPKPFF